MSITYERSNISRQDLTRLVREKMEGRFRADRAEILPLIYSGGYSCMPLEELESFLHWNMVDQIDHGDVFKCMQFGVALWGAFNDACRRDGGPEYPYAQGMMIGQHVYNWVVTSDGNLWFVEPQADWIMPPSPESVRPGHWNIAMMIG